MPSRFHRARQRRAERSASESSSERLNLVPLVDILTSIVFYALLTVTTAGGASLLAFNIGAPPVSISDGTLRPITREAPTVITVSVSRDRTVIRRGEGDSGIVVAHPAGIDRAALDRLEAALAAVHRSTAGHPGGALANVVPSDDVSYERVVGVLERVRKAEFREVSLGVLARKS